MFIDVFDTVFENCFDLIACAIAVLLLDCHNQIVKPEKYFLFVAISAARCLAHAKTFKTNRVFRKN